jgi:putative ABC transport system ATP-binding protein
VREAVLSNVELGFGAGEARVSALRRVHLTLPPGRLTLITGPSGGGKTSLLSVIGALIRPDAGSIMIGGTELTTLSVGALAEFRRRHVGFVFQAFRLMRSLSAEENILLSLSLKNVSNPAARAQAVLEMVGLTGRRRLRPDSLSGGEKQRVAVARALAHEPDVFLADEPTASLDAENGAKIMAMIYDLARRPGRIAVVVSHDERVRAYADQIVRFEDGQVIAGTAR